MATSNKADVGAAGTAPSSTPIPSDTQTKASDLEVGSVGNNAEGTDQVLSTSHPRSRVDDDKPPKEMADYQKAQADALEQQAKANADVGLTDDQKKANESVRKADDLRAKAQEKMSSGKQLDHSVADAGVLAVVPPTLKAGDHFAQKFGNDPENPRLADGIKADENLVQLSRVTPDVPGRVFTSVPKEMVGDYERAGWNRA